MRAVITLLLPLVVATSAVARASAQNLNIYFIDTEGGQSTLYVAPNGESLLVDSGNPGDRDHQRIMEAIRDAGVQRIDHFWLTHYHIDHHGGLAALAQAIPIRNFYDHGPSLETGGNTMTFQTTYAEITGRATRTIVKPGDRIPFGGMNMVAVTSNREVLRTPIAGAPGAGRPNAACSTHVAKDLSPFPDIDNDASAGFVLAFNNFRTINLGDFTWNLEHAMMCPNNPIGDIDLYLTSHHGLDRSGAPVLVHGLRPRVAIMNNGTRKGGSADALKVMWTSPRLQDVWQLHWSYTASVEHNAPGIFVANLDANPVLANIINAPAPTPGAPGGGGFGGGAGRGGGAPAAGAPGAAPGGAAPAGGAGRAGGAPPAGAPPAGAPPAGAGVGGGGRAGGPGAAPGGAPGGGAPGAGAAGGPATTTPAAHAPAYWIKVVVQPNGTFTVTNPRNGFSKTYTRE